MKIMGIDVGLEKTGYAIITDGELTLTGVIKTTRTLSLSERLFQLYERMRKLITKEKPQVAVYESIFYKQNPKSLANLAQARGVLLLAAQEEKVKIEEFTPTEIKKTITGTGRASKYQIHGMVERLVGKKIQNQPHIGDAVACGLCYLMKKEGVIIR
jgi:crossover junction endodeoxyribonuclease RuvC